MKSKNEIETTDEEVFMRPSKALDKFQRDMKADSMFHEEIPGIFEFYDKKRGDAAIDHFGTIFGGMEQQVILRNRDIRKAEHLLSEAFHKKWELIDMVRRRKSKLDNMICENPYLNSIQRSDAWTKSNSAARAVERKIQNNASEWEQNFKEAMGLI